AEPRNKRCSCLSKEGSQRQGRPDTTHCWSRVAHRNHIGPLEGGLAIKVQMVIVPVHGVVGGILMGCSILLEEVCGWCIYKRFAETDNDRLLTCQNRPPKLVHSGGG